MFRSISFQSQNLYLDSISLLDRLAPTQLDSADGSQAFENLDKSIVEIVQLMKHKGVRVRTLIEELKMLLEYRHDLVHEEHQDKEDT